MLDRNPFCGATLMVRADVLRVVGGYREAFEGYSHQDYDWACRIAERHEALNLPNYLYTYRQRPGSNSKKVDLRRAIGHRLVQHLARQRATEGSDAFIRGENSEIAALLAELSQPYAQDPALLFREFAGSLLYTGLYRQAISASFAAVKAR